MNENTDRPARVAWPPIVYVAAIAAAIVLTIFVRLPWLGSPLSDMLLVVGCILVAAVIGIDVSAMRALRRANTTLMPTRSADRLVTGGAYSISRNPIYLANSMLMVGVGFIAGALWFVLLAFLAGFATQKLAIEPEERHLERRFGKQYRDYAKKVRRWF